MNRREFITGASVAARRLCAGLLVLVLACLPSASLRAVTFNTPQGIVLFGGHRANALLLVNGTSYLLLSNGSSKLCLSRGC